MLKSFLPLHSPDDLNKVLTLQKIIRQQAQQELLAIAHKKHDDPKALLRQLRRLLKKYADYPSLSEFAAMPDALGNASKWGATFGVAALVGMLIYREAEKTIPHFQGNFNRALLLLLEELRQPRHRYLVEALESRMEISSGEKTLLAREVTAQLLLLGHRYKLVSLTEDGVAILKTGVRVRQHLEDAEKFILSVRQALPKFKASATVSASEKGG